MIPRHSVIANVSMTNKVIKGDVADTMAILVKIPVINESILEPKLGRLLLFASPSVSTAGLGGLWEGSHTFLRHFVLYDFIGK